MEIYQDVELKAGQYTLGAFINRFYATGTEGILSELGGLVELGIIGLKDAQPVKGTEQFSAFDVTYGVGKYQLLENYITITEPGQYRVLIRITGDAQFGLGMQIDDVTLCATQYPDSVSGTVTGTEGKRNGTVDCYCPLRGRYPGNLEGWFDR